MLVTCAVVAWPVSASSQPVPTTRRPAPADTLRPAALADSIRRATLADSAALRAAPVADTSAAGVVIVPGASDSASAEVERVLREATSRRRATAASTAGRFDAPRWVMLRSALIPGWGQFHNRAWLKSIGVAAAEGLMIAKLFQDERDLDRLSRAADRAQDANDEPAFVAAVTAYNARLTETINRRWLFGGLLAYALADAYVDAHFSRFNVEFDTGTSGGSSRPGARLRLGWSF